MACGEGPIVIIPPGRAAAGRNATQALGLGGEYGQQRHRRPSGLLGRQHRRPSDVKVLYIASPASQCLIEIQIRGAWPPHPWFPNVQSSELAFMSQISGSYKT